MPLVGNVLVPPTLVNPQTFTLPDPASLGSGGWTPALTSGRDWILDMRSYKMDKQVTIQGGANGKIVGAHTTRANSDGGPNFMVSGGTGQAQRTCYFEGWLCDASGGFESDGLRTRNSPTTASDTHLEFAFCRIVNLRGQTNSGATDIAGLTSGGTHADCIQLAGGAASLKLYWCTLMSRYANLQAQHEQFELSTGTFPVKTITNAVRSGASPNWQVTLTFSGNHGITDPTSVSGFWAQVGKHTGGGTDLNPSGFCGTYEILSVPDTTHVVLAFKKKTPPSSFTSGGTFRLSQFIYDVGDLWWSHTNVQCLPNDQQRVTNNPGETINAWRFGSRPDYKGFEDQTPLIIDGSPNQHVTLDQFYIDPLNNSIGSLVNPGSGGSIYVDGAALIDTAPNPDEITYPNHPRFTGKAFVGPPPGGDFCPAGLAGRRYPRIPRVRVS